MSETMLITLGPKVGVAVGASVEVLVGHPETRNIGWLTFHEGFDWQVTASREDTPWYSYSYALSLARDRFPGG
jgi:hypothetical protein